eukprot:TRINITY_DN10565_c1_g1_i1.p1 TRINITY_DN10565_c1_g1~~TRINITY_DN10565_c1_g1_i1.p1  ORF type:complete len:372 (+),score=73.80 TRINITY_DN10565_c1_g1_i1:53-1168(+)
MMRRTVARFCGPAAKRTGRSAVADGNVMGGVDELKAPATSAEGVKTKFTMDEFEEKISQTAAAIKKGEKDGFDPESPNAPEVLQKSFKKFKETEAQQGRLSDQDGLFNMTPSGTEAKPIRPIKVFWKEVDVEKASDTWWKVKLDNRYAAAFESKDHLVVPSEEFAYALAHEWGSQGAVINRFSMPLTDVASGAHQVQPDGLQTRLSYLLEFFKHDHMFYRQEAVRDRQDELIEPVLEWADRMFDISTPRIEGIRRAVFDPQDFEKMKNYLISANLNKYQLVCLTVMSQYMSSLILPLAVVNQFITLEEAVTINRIEEDHNINSTASVEGYHDIRESDSTVKMAACYCAYQFTKSIKAHDCFPDPSLLKKSA